MAGAAPQQRGSNGTTVGMVISIIVAAALLGVLIWLFTQQENLRRTAEDAQKVKERLASAADESKARQLYPEAGSGGKTLLGDMNREVQLLCDRIGGSQSDPPKVALDKLEAAVKAVGEAGKVPSPEQLTIAAGAAAIIDTLHQLYVKEREASQKAEMDLNKALTDLDATSRANAELDQKFQAELAKLKASVEALQNAKSDFERTKSSDLEAVKEQVSAKQDQLDAARREQAKLMERVRAEINERDKLLAEQRDALQDLRGPGALGAQELAIARKPVGTVLRALPGDSLVHIDLGRRDNVTLGMTFSVYSVDEQVPSDGRGKANIEVVSVGDRTAECRVTSPPSPDDPILDGDRVGNIILSRTKAKKPQFVIVGGFDIDYDGTVDIRGREAIAALVKRYGGEVVDEVTPMTDYVVVGVEVEDGGPALEAGDLGTAAAEAKAQPEGSEEEEAESAEPDDDNADEDADAEAADAEEDEQNEIEADEDGDEDAEDEEKAGEEPAVQESKPAVTPAIPRPQAVDPTARTSRRRALSERERYYEAIRRAEMFSIPRLPQDRFLNFVGIEPGPGAARRLQQ